MRRYGSSKRNPNPAWPGVQTPVVLPPGSTSSAIGRNNVLAENNNSDNVPKANTLHERDGFVPIMSYMTESEGMRPIENNYSETMCSNMGVCEYLRDKTGGYARVEFLFGENTHVEKTGILENVGKDFIVLTEAGTGSRIVCMAKNVKFINLYNVK